MPETLALSESAVAVLRFEIKGWEARDPRRRLPASRALAAVGIMEPVPGSDTEYRFTADGRARCEAILRAEEDRIERERFEPPDASNGAIGPSRPGRRADPGVGTRMTSPPPSLSLSARIRRARSRIGGAVCGAAFNAAS
jgi:hypothetical protein